MRHLQKFARPWAPGLVVIVLLLVLFMFDSGSVAILLGSGAGSLISPALLVLVLVLSLATKSWWHSVVGMALLAIVNRLVFTRPLGDEMPGWDIISGLGAFCVGLIVISLFSGARHLLSRKKATEHV